jgi:hypothetical protein
MAYNGKMLLKLAQNKILSEKCTKAPIYRKLVC